MTRDVTFTEGRIDAHFTAYADQDCSAPLLELRFGGDVVVQGPSTVAEGAREVDLIVNDYLTVTPRIEGFADVLNSADPGACGGEDWAVGIEQDVFETGCTVMGVAPNTPTFEYEVLYVSAGQLYFGARPVDGRSLDDAGARPTALQMRLRLAEGGMTWQVGEGDVREPIHVEIVRFRQFEGADAFATMSALAAISSFELTGFAFNN